MIRRAGIVMLLGGRSAFGLLVSPRFPLPRTISSLLIVSRAGGLNAAKLSLSTRGRGLHSSADDDNSAFVAMTVLGLKDELRKRKLKVSGTKSVLIERLTTKMATQELFSLTSPEVSTTDISRKMLSELRDEPPSEHSAEISKLPAVLSAAIVARLASQLGLERWRVEAAVKLFEGGNTLPFIARYRKEATGEMDETALRELEAGLESANKLEARRLTMISTLEDLDVLTPELRAQFKNPSVTLTELEDLYLPLRPKRKTRASDARKRGLQPLADALMGRPASPYTELRHRSFKDVAAELVLDLKPTLSIDEAIAGARDIVAEETMEQPSVRSFARERLRTGASLSSTMKKAKGKEPPAVYNMYVSFSSHLARLQPHQILAINRGEKAKALVVDVSIDPATENYFRAWLEKHIIPQGGDPSWAQELFVALNDGTKRLLLPALVREWRNELTSTAEAKSFVVYATNLRQKLLAPPLKGKVVLALDPGLRTGCKLAIVSSTGVPLFSTTLMIPLGDTADTSAIVAKLISIINSNNVGLIAIGNGTGSREAEAVVVAALQGTNLEVNYTIVDESGASVYSASPLATKELPQYDVAIRGAISLARRIQDPLSEHVKIDPKALGVGMYQHDVDQKVLAQELVRVVSGAVNAVGVDVNTASPSLLKHVSGLSSMVSEAIIAARDSKPGGRFDQIEDVLKVKGVGPKAYQQAAGFLRVYGGPEPFDSTEVHPESYAALRRGLERLGSSWRGGVDASTLELVAAEVGLGQVTLKDALVSLGRDGRDPRDDLLGVPPPILLSASDSNLAGSAPRMTLGALKVGAELQGVIKNVVDFGAFVDLGIGADGLLHVSKFPRGPERDRTIMVGVRAAFTVTALEIQNLKAKKARISLELLV